MPPHRTRRSYLIRFDDVCPTMNWDVWDQVEEILHHHDIRPIVAIVPDNQDPQLVRGSLHSGFWERARKWQSAGWAIALHGYQHLYSTAGSGLLGLNPRSEFAGHPFELQLERLRAGKAIMESESITPRLWIAPAHSFDSTTLGALREIGLMTISDGFYLRPVLDSGGFVWIPQQIWRLRSTVPGTWTVCLHVNGWSAADVRRFSCDVERFKDEIITIDQILEGPISSLTAWDRAFAKCYGTLLRARRRLRRLAPEHSG